jgi:hypothetical protein
LIGITLIAGFEAVLPSLIRRIEKQDIVPVRRAVTAKWGMVEIIGFPSIDESSGSPHIASLDSLPT